jgi:hypothetical protein
MRVRQNNSAVPEKMWMMLRGRKLLSPRLSAMWAVSWAQDLEQFTSQQQYHNWLPLLVCTRSPSDQVGPLWRPGSPVIHWLSDKLCWL